MSARNLVRTALTDKITDLGYAALEDRGEDDATLESELPFVLIQQAGPIDVGRRESINGGDFEHIAPFFLSFAAKTERDAEQMLIATANELATDYSLGGQVQEIVPVSWGDEETELRDAFALVLEIRVTFCTPHNDWAVLS